MHARCEYDAAHLSSHALSRDEVAKDMGYTMLAVVNNKTRYNRACTADVARQRLSYELARAGKTGFFTNSVRVAISTVVRKSLWRIVMYRGREHAS